MEAADQTTSLQYAGDANRGSQPAAPTNRLEMEAPDPAWESGQKASRIREIATEAFAKTGSWVVFFREMLGTSGVARKAYPTQEQYEQFQTTQAHAELQEMVAAIRSQDTSKGDSVEAERMITIRLPKSLHDVLTLESNEMNLSINKLCISKLLQPIEGRFVPVQQGRRRGRRPGPQGSRKRSNDQDAQQPQAVPMNSEFSQNP